MQILPFQKRQPQRDEPLICFTDLQVEYIVQGRPLALEQLTPWMENCRRLLSFARQNRMSISHFRQLWKTPLLNAATPFASWIEEFRPRPSEMSFDRQLPSCYAAKDFVSVVDNIENPHLVLAGLTGHGACLATVLDGFHRKHRITYVADASWTPALGTLASSAAHAYVTEIIACYADVVPTDQLIEWFSGATWRPGIANGDKG
ncbi:MAG: isochorismatase family protein [Xanthobacteraceae bacterium]